MRAEPRSLDCRFLGRVPWDEANALQEALRDRLRRGEAPETLLLLEHPHVYTLGRSADPAGLLLDAGELASRGIQVRECDRGGQATYHGPGQLVGYPVLDLNPDRRDLRRYVRGLQETLVRVLHRFGVEGEARHEQAAIGVWVGERKIASLGVHAQRWITTHGFALNVSTDLSYFAGIVPCGLAGVRMTSLEEATGVRVPLDRVAEVTARSLREVLGYRRAAPAVGV